MIYAVLLLILIGNVDRVKVLMQFHTELLHLKKEKPKNPIEVKKTFITSKKQAIKEKKNLVVTVGNRKMIDIPGVVCYKAKSLTTYPDNCVIIFVYDNNTLKAHKCLIGDVSVENCIKELKSKFSPKTFRKSCGPNGCQITN